MGSGENKYGPGTRRHKSARAAKRALSVYFREFSRERAPRLGHAVASRAGGVPGFDYEMQFDAALRRCGGSIETLRLLFRRAGAADGARAHLRGVQNNVARDPV